MAATTLALYTLGVKTRKNDNIREDVAISVFEQVTPKSKNGIEIPLSERKFYCPPNIQLHLFEKSLPTVGVVTKFSGTLKIPHPPAFFDRTKPFLAVAFQIFPPRFQILGFAPYYTEGILYGQLSSVYVEQNVPTEKVISSVPEITNAPLKPIQQIKLGKLYLYSGTKQFPSKMNKEILLNSILSFWWWIRRFTQAQPKNIPPPQKIMDYDILFNVMLLACYEDPQELIHAYSCYIRLHLNTAFQDKETLASFSEKLGKKLTGAGEIEADILSVVHKQIARLRDTKDTWTSKLNPKIEEILEKIRPWFKGKLSIRDSLFSGFMS